MTGFPIPYETNPCPFCGESKFVYRDLYVECHNCGAQGPAATDKIEAIEYWNEREEPNN